MFTTMIVWMTLAGVGGVDTHVANMSLVPVGDCRIAQAHAGAESTTDGLLAFDKVLCSNDDDVIAHAMDAAGCDADHWTRDGEGTNTYQCARS